MTQPAIALKLPRIVVAPRVERRDVALAGYAVLPLVAVARAVIVALLALSAGYGFHRDELYFIVAGRHPAFGYVDQPPITPILSALSVAVFGLSPTAVRLLPALSAGIVVALVGAMTRDFGGSRRAQLIAALVAAVSGVLAVGHLDNTATYDLLDWTVILWLVARLLRGADPRLWLAVGIAGGIGLENKDTPLFLAAGLGAGIVLSRPLGRDRMPMDLGWNCGRGLDLGS